MKDRVALFPAAVAAQRWWWLVCQGREVDDKDTFRYNRDFAAALFRVKINAIQLKETVEENKKTNDQVLQDRQYQARPTLPCF